MIVTIQRNVWRKISTGQLNKIHKYRLVILEIPRNILHSMKGRIELIKAGKYKSLGRVTKYLKIL